MRRMLALLVLFAPGCSEHMQGALEIEFREQTVSFEPCACNSGEELGFFGVELWAEETHDVLVFDHSPIDGPRLAFWPGWDGDRKISMVVLPAEDCRVFDGELKRTDDEIDEVSVMRGVLELDCTTPDGDTLRGELEFDQCASLDARTNSFD